MKLELSKTGNRLLVIDLEDTEKYEVYDSALGQRVPKTRPRSIASADYGLSYACCGIGELCRFNLPEDNKEKRKECISLISKNLIMHLKKDRYSLVYAVFLKDGKEKKYDNQDFMEALLKEGWKPLGNSFLNRRYGTGTRGHTLQALVYLIQARKKGNAYEQVDDLS
jgi:CO dehydrogenase/acetyl-CoA synthase alpha subunit